MRRYHAVRIGHCARAEGVPSFLPPAMIVAIITRVRIQEWKLCILKLKFKQHSKWEDPT